MTNMIEMKGIMKNSIALAIWNQEDVKYLPTLEYQGEARTLEKIKSAFCGQMISK